MGFLLGMAMKFNNIRHRGDIDLKIAQNASKLRRTQRDIKNYESQNTKVKQFKINELSLERSNYVANLPQELASAYFSGDDLNKYLSGDYTGLDAGKLSALQNKVNIETANYDARMTAFKSKIEEEFDLQNNMSYQALKDLEEQLEQEKTQLEAEKQIADKEKELAESMSKSGLDNLFPKYGS